MSQLVRAKWRLAVDVGGTFIDFALVNQETGEVIVDKQPSRPETLVDEFMAGVKRLPVDVADIEMIIHGTTHGLNALVEERGANVGLLTTRGFRDVLMIGRASRPDMYDPHYAPKKPLIRRSRIREITERLDAHGEVVTALSLTEVDAAVDALVGDEVTAIAITFLHAYQSSRHEHEAAQRIRQRHPALSVVCSSDIAREWREFERTSTAVSNAFIQTGFAQYVEQVKGRLLDVGYTREIAFMQSNGGTVPSTIAAVQPIRTLNSGPAGGIMGARNIARRLGLDNVIATDVGGTTYDVGLILNSEVQERTSTSVNGRPILAPSVDIISIGAGGGSIASIDPVTGSLRVGPESAGATPGPVCFGRGGTRPTVTDAQLRLGRLDPTRFLESRMQLDRSAASTAIESQLATPGGIDVDTAADGALEVAEANMANAIRQITTERGLDPREFTLLSYGGGGGLFAAYVCENLDIDRVVIPEHPAAFSAWGMLSAGYREDRAVTRLRDVNPGTAEDIIADFRALVEEARSQLSKYGLSTERAEVSYKLDARFQNQAHALEIPVETAWLDSPSQFARELPVAFEAAHRMRFGHGDARSPVEVVSTRIRMTVQDGGLDGQPGSAPAPSEALRTRSVFFRGRGWQETPVRDRASLAVGEALSGPAIVDDTAATIVVPPSWTIRRHESGALLMQREEAVS